MVNGVLPIRFGTLAMWHPQFALAILKGCPVRPNLRTLQATFSTNAVGTVEPASFDQQVSRYSVFTGVAVSIDPTGAFAGNTFKTLSDSFQAKVTGITLNLVIRSRGSDYAPIPDDIPLEMIEKTLNPTAGMWKFDNPDNPKAQFTIIDSPPGENFTVWVTFNLLVLGEGANPYLCKSATEARAELAADPGFAMLCKLDVA